MSASSSQYEPNPPPTVIMPANPFPGSLDQVFQSHVGFASYLPVFSSSPGSRRRLFGGTYFCLLVADATEEGGCGFVVGVLGTVSAAEAFGQDGLLQVPRPPSRRLHRRLNVICSGEEFFDPGDDLPLL